MAAPQSNQIQDIENNFTKGLITEFTGLNFPSNAATDTQNCIYTLVGDVIRREGFDYENNAALNIISTVTNKAISSYKWNNVGGDGETQVVVEQVGGTLYFYTSSAATTAAPLSAQKLSSTVDISSFVATGGSFDATVECQFADGNGYLFVCHPNCDPFYCTYVAGTVTGNIINIQIRDFIGIPDGLPITSRPATLSAEHNYNLNNQGWTSGNAWFTTSSTPVSPGGMSSIAFTVASTTGISGGDTVNIYSTDPFSTGQVASNVVVLAGTVASIVSSVVTVTITYDYGGTWSTGTYGARGVWNLVQTNLGHITLWHSDIGNYPSNADVWWYFKDTTNVFNPTTMNVNVTLSSAVAPQGHFVMNAFNQQRGLLSGVAGLTDITTTVRPKTGCWFQGRVWYAGVDAQQAAAGDEPYTTWTENIYVSQVVSTPADFGSCYQQNDPTSEQLFDLLPTDGGVVVIQGCGSIYKLFPLMNALLVFAANGVWYLTGSQGIGFAANDYTIVKLSAVKSISGTSFVDINGLPMFWNEEGIYQVEPAKQGQGLLNSPLHVNPLEVNPLTVGTILTYYNNIPLQSKKYARGAYSPIDYVVQWTFKNQNEVSVTDRYSFDTILCMNTYNKAFYPYMIDITTSNVPKINGIVYVSSPGGSSAPNSVFKYLTTTYSGGNTYLTFSEELDTDYVDWATSTVSNNYISYFVTGYKLQGQGQRRFQIPYVYVYSRLGQPVSYYIQSIWDFATSANSGRWSTRQQVNINNPNYGMDFKRHRLRGRGLVLQIKVSSVDGQPFDIMGWSGFEIQNLGI